MSSQSPLTRPLDLRGFAFRGAQVIEASAGPGKTWTLAALYLRLVLGEGLPSGPLLPPRILVMTFTEAATKELRDRIRKRLTLAARYFRGAAEEGNGHGHADAVVVSAPAPQAADLLGSGDRDPARVAALRAAAAERRAVDG